jgi:histidyl-tRNA synthetase
VLTLEETRPGQCAAVLDLFIAPLGEAAYRHVAPIATTIRRAGRPVEVAPETKLKRALELANKLGARYALIVGDDEISAGAYQLKNMATGQQETVTLAELYDRLQLKGEHAG